MKNMTSVTYPTLSILSLVTLLVAGCSSTPTQVDSGPIQAKTFRFVSVPPGSVPAFADRRQEMHTMIQSSISRNLAAKGVTQVTTGGDVVVAYLVIIGDNASTTAINTYFGQGRDVAALHDEAQMAYTSNKSPDYFKAGTLLVDIIDAETYALLKRSHVSRPILGDPSAEVRAERIQEAVDAVLKDLRIGQ
jgi:PBP1b-binding outer membrane lipoprotein LpoB